MKSKFSGFWEENKQIILVLIVMVLLISGAIVFFLNSQRFSKYDFGGTYGQIGDFFNGISTPILTLFVALFAYKTFKSQRGQLKIQDEQLEIQNNHLNLQVKQLEIQKQDAAKQRIESIFFQLLNLHNNIVKDLEYDNNRGVFKSEKSRSLKGRSYFSNIYYECILIYIEKESKNQGGFEKLLKDSWTTLDSYQKDKLQHYYRNLFQLFKWIEKNESSLEINELNDFVEIIRAQLSLHETCLLYLNAKYYGEHLEFFKLLNEKFKLFPQGIEQQFLSDVLKEKTEKVQVS